MEHPGEPERILVVDDAPDTLEVLRRNLTSQGYQVFTAPGVSEALSIVASTPLDLVITDLKMPGVSGIDLVRHVRENLKDTEVMMITGYATIEGAVEAVKTGAEEYLAKPFTAEELTAAARRSLDKLRRRRAAQPQTEHADMSRFGLVSESEVMQEVFDAVAKAAESNATVLITGESGTGKELVARAIHYRSLRASAPFVPVNCGGIPEGLLQSELFGHVKGAFTGAIESRAGFFQTADGGTIFLDEISDMGLSMQAKLLRVLEDRQVVMLGSDRSREVDVRILAATNKDLHELVEHGEFRGDLYFRINVVSIVIPPLRERGDDIPLLAHHFAERFARALAKEPPEFSNKAIKALQDYPWPGNVRELENVVHRLVVMSEGNVIDVTDLPSLMRFSALHRSGLDRTLAEIEAEYTRNVLARVDGNRTAAAKILGIDRKTLRNKLKSFPPPEKPPDASPE